MSQVNVNLKAIAHLYPPFYYTEFNNKTMQTKFNLNSIILCAMDVAFNLTRR